MFPWTPVASFAVVMACCYAAPNSTRLLEDDHQIEEPSLSAVTDDCPKEDMWLCEIVYAKSHCEKDYISKTCPYMCGMCGTESDIHECPKADYIGCGSLRLPRDDCEWDDRVVEYCPYMCGTCSKNESRAQKVSATFGSSHSIPSECCGFDRSRFSADKFDHLLSTKADDYLHSYRVLLKSYSKIFAEMDNLCCMLAVC